MTATPNKYLSRNPIAQGDNHLELVYGGYSTKGIKDENQDAFAVLAPGQAERLTKGTFVAVADGVSSASHGKEAAQLAVTMAADEYLATPESWSTQKSLTKVLTSLNRWLCGQANKAASHTSDQQWLTTLSGMILKSATATIFHVGDSRIYKFTPGSESQDSVLEQITQDHVSLLGSNHSILNRALGADPQIKIDTLSLALNPGEVFLLCSDGLSSFLTEREMRQQLNTLNKDADKEALEHLSTHLCNLALKNGSNDNISSLLVRVETVASRKLDELQRCLQYKAIPAVMRSGQTLDGFRILRQIHASPRSHLYLVEETGTKEIKVLKAPSENFVDDNLYLQGFINESWVGERLSHQNVMKVIPPSSKSQFLYHLCEYIDGQSLSQWITDNPKPTLAQLRAIVEQLILALRAFQRLELLHRDVKPDNVLIDSSGQLKLVDYGTVFIPALAENEHIQDGAVPQGAIRYMAPETYQNGRYTFASEMFSLGITCYELLTGQVPYKALENDKLYAGHRSGWQYRPIRLLRPELPQWIEVTLEKACHAEADRRYTSYSEFWQDLSQPNHEQLKAIQNQPLIERNPVRFWQGISALLATALLISLVY